MMDEPRHDSTFQESLHLRVTELETQYAKQKRSTTLLVIGMVGAVAIGIAGLSTARALGKAGSLQAREFTLRGEDGMVHGAWRVNEDGSSTLSLNDRNGIERARLKVLDNGESGFALADAKGRPLVVLSLLQDLTGTLVFADEEGNTRAVLGLSADGAAKLFFGDPSGTQQVVIVGVEANGRPTFSMTDLAHDSVSEPGGSR